MYYVGSQLDPKKISIITNFPTLKTVINVKAFMGLMGYYIRFIIGYVKIA